MLIALCWTGGILLLDLVFPLTQKQSEKVPGGRCASFVHLWTCWFLTACPLLPSDTFPNVVHQYHQCIPCYLYAGQIWQIRSSNLFSTGCWFSQNNKTEVHQWLLSSVWNPLLAKLGNQQMSGHHSDPELSIFGESMVDRTRLLAPAQRFQGSNQQSLDVSCREKGGNDSRLDQSVWEGSLSDDGGQIWGWRGSNQVKEEENNVITSPGLLLRPHFFFSTIVYLFVQDSGVKC